MRTVLVLSLLLGLGSWAAPSQAQSDSGLAEILFRDAKKLLEAKEYDQACAKFAESQRLDPSTGTLLGLAICHEGQGKLATAWAEYNDVVPLARTQGRPERAEAAQHRAAALEPRLARLVVTVRAGRGGDAVELALDGRPLGAAVLGSAMPIDPGAHSLTATAPGKRPWSRDFSIDREGQAIAVEVPPLGDAIPAPTATAYAAPPAPPSLAPSPSSWGAQRTLAVVAGGLAVGGVVVGSVFGARAYSSSASSKSECPSPTSCPQHAQAVTDHDAAATASTTSTIAFVAAAAFAAGGVVLYVTAPSRRASTGSVRLAPAVSASGAGFLAEGTFW
jgi:hypothetical protein